MINEFIGTNYQLRSKVSRSFFSTFRVLENLRKDGGSRYANLNTRVARDYWMPFHESQAQIL